MTFLEFLLPNLPWLATAIAVADVLIILIAIPWILTIKREPTSAVAWSLVVILVPLLGFLLFVLFGYNHVYRPLRRKRSHRARYRARFPSGTPTTGYGEAIDHPASRTYHRLGEVAVKLGAFPVLGGNRVEQFHDTAPAFDVLFETISQARHHVHAEFFIVQPDSTGRAFLDRLIERAKAGVEVRLLYDAIGSRRLTRKLIRSVREAGVRMVPFMPLDPLRRRIQINLRNHRKLVVVDGTTAFTGGMNIGDEYLGKVPRFGYWRDSFLRLEGPAVSCFQKIFVEDWDFSAGEAVSGAAYYPAPTAVGPHVVQVIESGPDQQVNAMRELLFSAVAVARDRVWISTPYIVPDQGILDALKMSARFGVDVRILWLHKPDHQLPYWAARYFLPELLAEGVKIYQYARGMMHAKYMIVDGKWGWLGSTNLDNRSLVLHFEANCLFHSPELVAELEAAFQHDMQHCVRLEGRKFAERPFLARMTENCCRLLSPLL